MSYAVREFLMANGVSPSHGVTKSISTWLDANRLVHFGFDVVHVRFGDQQNWKLSKATEVERAIRSIGSTMSRTVWISDNPAKLKNMLPEGSKIREARGSHLGQPADFSEEKISMEDFFLMAYASKIVQISRYAWGSGFSQSAASIWGIPLENYQV
jgi:hypothetical protein